MGLIPAREDPLQPTQYSCPENSMDRRAWRAKVYGVAELDTTERLTHIRTNTHTHVIPSCWPRRAWVGLKIPFHGDSPGKHDLCFSASAWWFLQSLVTSLPPSLKLPSRFMNLLSRSSPAELLLSTPPALCWVWGSEGEWHGLRLPGDSVPPSPLYFLRRTVSSLLHHCSIFPSGDKRPQGKSWDLELWSPPYKYPGCRLPRSGQSAVKPHRRTEHQIHHSLI